MPSIDAIIPARSGSKGIPNKNIVDVAGHPLLAYSIALCEECTNIRNIYVSTDCEHIAEIAQKYGAQIIMRPQEFALDNSTDDQFLNHFFDIVPVQDVALMRPTTPLRVPEYVDSAIIEYYAHYEQLTSLRSVNETNESPYKVYKVEDNYCRGFFKDFNGITDYSNLPRQVFPKTFQANGHIDIIKKSTIKSGSTYGEQIYAKIGKKIIDIDCQFDLDMLKLQIRNDTNCVSKILKRKKHG
tara:strand:- start:20837 stop:21559 length:723 start_codon:yes stop_codon:yes gene_type:complete